MKKILSLMCAFAIVLGAYATPQLATKRLAVEKQKFEQKSIPAQKQVNPDLAALKKNALRAPKAKKAETNVTLVDEVIDLNFTTSCSKKYYADTKDWYLVAQNSDYAVVLDLFSNNADNIPTGSFESENFDLYYTGIYDFEVGNSLIKATSAAAEISVSNDTTFIFAVLECNDGKTYRAKFFYTDPKYKDPVEVAIATATSTDYGTDMYYTLKNAAGDSIFYFDIYKDQSAQDITLGQTYTKDDMDGSYSWMKLAGTSVTYYSAEFKKTKTDGLVRIEATVSDKEGNVYHLVYQEKGVVPTGEEVTLKFDSAMNVPQYYDDGAWELYTKQGDTTVAFVYVNNTPTSAAGNYTAENLQAQYSGIMFGDEYIAFASGSFSVTETDARIDLTADMLGKNGVLYHISMFFIKPVASSQETISSNELTINAAYFDWYGIITFEAGDANNAISLTVNANGKGAQMAGEYVAGTDFNGTVTPTNGTETEIYSGSIVIAVAENGDVTLTGTVLGANNIEYTLNLKYIKPEAIVNNIEITAVDITKGNNYVRYTLSNADYYFFFTISLASGEDVESGKTYTFADDMGADTYTSYGMDKSYNYIDYASATFVKTVSASQIKIEVSIVDVDGNTWNLTYTEPVPTAVDAINAENNAVKRIVNGQVVIEKNGVFYNILGTEIK